jgi:lipid A 3-O-deacylase
MPVRKTLLRCAIWLRVFLVMAGLAAAPVLSRAQSLPPPDPTGIWTLQDENASISTSNLTDRYYVNGLRLGYTTGTSGVPDPFAALSRWVWGEGRQRLSFDITQQIFTPDDTEATVPPPGDRPYAGILLGNLGVISDTNTTRSTLGLSLGVIGPWSGAEQVQNGFHSLIGQSRDNGWSTQLHNEPALQLLAARVWRLPLGRLGGLETDALPALQAGLGNVRIYGLGGVSFRIGQGLKSDFGPARVQPGLSGSDAFTPTRPLVWYVFAGADGQVVGHDVTLNGNTWQSSPSVELTPLVAEFQAGIAIIAHGVRVSYTQVFQTQEFHHQKGGLHQFGSLALSVRF